MINFEQEMEKFKPIINVDNVESHINKEKMLDVVDLLKALQEQNNEEMEVFNK